MDAPSFIEKLKVSEMSFVFVVERGTVNEKTPFSSVVVCAIWVSPMEATRYTTIVALETGVQFWAAG